MRHATRQLFSNFDCSDESAKAGVPTQTIAAKPENRAELAAAVAVWIDLMADVIVQEITQMSLRSEEPSHGETHH